VTLHFKEEESLTCDAYYFINNDTNEMRVGIGTCESESVKVEILGKREISTFIRLSKSCTVVNTGRKEFTATICGF
jgi:hypothetical protein